MARDEEAETRLGASILIIDDERNYRGMLGEGLRLEGNAVYEASNGDQGFRFLSEETIQIVLLDLKLKESGENGIDILRRIRNEQHEVEVVMITAFADLDSAFEAGRLGCFQYILKTPTGINFPHIQGVIRDALQKSTLRREVEVLKRAESGRYPLTLVEGESPRMRQLLDEADKIAEGSTTILIRGETGVGKELVARRVHMKSPVAAGPFVEVNCSALPENLLESELFGYEKGAFTDAKKRKKGLFELADNGTLFLDEIGEMSVALQAKLLRALESKAFKRVGGTSNVYVNVRIVAATNRDLKKAVADGDFREDLYYRLSVVPVVIPPLRERPEDVAILASHFVAHFNRELRKSVSGISDRAMELLKGYAWPGNVRELRNVVERAILLGSGERIEPDHLPVEILSRASTVTTGATGLAEEAMDKGGILTIAEAEQYAIQTALTRFKDNKTRAAEALGISRQTLRAKIREYGLPE